MLETSATALCGTTVIKHIKTTFLLTDELVIVVHVVHAVNGVRLV